MSNDKKLGLFSLMALVVGSMIGGGIFNLATDMASGAGSIAILVGWVITGIGMISLGLCFQNLNMKRHDLDGGVYSYAKAGFGDFMGFNSAWGYWVSAFLGNVAYATLLFSSLGYFFPIFEGGQTVEAIIGASILLWGVHFLILRGVHSAAILNLITTIAKLIPVLVFVIVVIFAFKVDIFTSSFWGDAGSFSWSAVADQVKNTMLVTVWVFIGIEGAVVFSSREKNRADVGKATILGLVGTLIIYALISLLSLGAMQQAELAALDSPSMAYLMEHMVGKWGAVLINIGLIISVSGAWLGWTLLASEIPYIGAKDGVFPKWFGAENKNKAPKNALWVTHGFIQVFILTFLFTESAYNLMFSLASSAILIPYAFSAFYQYKYTLGTKDPDRTKNLIVGVIASIYSIWLVYAAGLDYLLLTVVLFAIGIPVFFIIQKEQNKEKIFTKAELFVAIAFVILAIWGVYELVTGGITC